jgi:hypothetical protein
MEREQFFRAMAFALETLIKPPLNFGLPGRIIHAEALANMSRQFQTILHRKLVHRALKFNHAHHLIVPGLRIFSTEMWLSGGGIFGVGSQKTQTK